MSHEMDPEIVGTTQSPHHKRFSVWSEVLMDQELSEGMKSNLSFTPSAAELLKRSTKGQNSKKKHRAKLVRRDVESFVIPPTLVNDKDQKRPDKKVRPGNKKSTKKLKKKRQSQDKNNSEIISKSKKKKLKKLAKQNSLVMEIAQKLSEPRIDLIHRVVQVIGEPMAQRIFAQTLDVEAAGGLMTSTGSRRRTAGGVFFHLVKHDKGVTPKHIEAIWADEIEREQKKLNKKMKKQKKKFDRLTEGFEQFKLNVGGSSEGPVGQENNPKNENNKDKGETVTSVTASSIMEIDKVNQQGEAMLEEGEVNDSDDDL